MYIYIYNEYNLRNIKKYINLIPRSIAVNWNTLFHVDKIAKKEKKLQKIQLVKVTFVQAKVSPKEEKDKKLK